MAITNHERAGKAMELLRAGLAPFVEPEVQSAVKGGRGIQTIRNYAEDPNLARRSLGEWDVAALLKQMWEAWSEVVRRTLGPSERGLFGEQRGHRNRWARGEPGAPAATGAVATRAASPRRSSPTSRPWQARSCR